MESFLYFLAHSFSSSIVCVTLSVSLAFTHIHTYILYSSVRATCEGENVDKETSTSKARSVWGREKWECGRRIDKQSATQADPWRVDLGVASLQPLHWFSCQSVKYPAAISSFCLSSVRNESLHHSRWCHAQFTHLTSNTFSNGKWNWLFFIWKFGHDGPDCDVEGYVQIDISGTTKFHFNKITALTQWKCWFIGWRNVMHWTSVFTHFDHLLFIKVCYAMATPH